MAIRGSPQWKENIRKGVSKAWTQNKYKDVDYSKSPEQRNKLSKAKKKFYQEHPKVAIEHSQKLKGTMIGKNNPNYGKKHIGLNAGSKNHFYKGGRTINTARGLNWRNIRQAIRIKYDSTCQRCSQNKEGRDLHVHHRIPYCVSMDNSESNLTLLCNSCHQIIEDATQKYIINQLGYLPDMTKIPMHAVE